MKKIIFGIAAFALVGVSCDRNEVTDFNGKTGETISLGATTTRGAINYVDELETNSFWVWATAATGNGTEDWAVLTGDTDTKIVRGLEHKLTSSIWNFVPPLLWPAINDSKYPLTFYGFYPQPSNDETLVAGILELDDKSTLEGKYTVIDVDGELNNAVNDITDGNDQADLLFATSTANNRPASSNLVMAFDHILSKIDFTATVFTDWSLYIQGLEINNVSNSGTINFKSTPEWTLENTYATDYTYYGTVWDAPTGHSTVLNVRTITGGSSVAPEAIYTAADNSNHLMLMPQTDADQKLTKVGKGVDPGETNTELNSKSYVSMVYRLANVNSSHADPNLVGYANASSHPDYVGSKLDENDYTGPLFVKVAFPFELAWVPTKGYIYNLKFDGSDQMTGGYLIDENYYDENGDVTDLEVGGKDGEYPDIPDPIFNTDKFIHLIPTVTDWADQTPQDLN